MPNRLIHEKSPYLKQHANNPVDWRPWGPEAFEAAQSEDKPILLSIGYSTCHWCHVMEHESFAVANTAAVMNQWLICVKLDREERPDVDALYMSAVTSLTGQGGWPLNVFLTPDLKPFYGGTYFPPRAGFGRPAWVQMVEAIGRAWKNPGQRAQILEDSSKMTEALKTLGQASAPEKELKAEWMDTALASFQRDFDPNHGGFGGAPKFPMPVNQAFLMRYALHKTPAAASARAMALLNLRKMALGGIQDHLGGGFARYSTDETWLLPHFEKMLYDNAQLAVNYLEAMQLSGDAAFGETARGILEYVLRDLRSPEGAFYSAEDADSLDTEGEKVEGAFYVWTRDEILKELGESEGAVFCSAYGVKEEGNLPNDPHGEFYQKNVLHPDPDWKGDYAGLELSRRKLFELRCKRPRPHRDEKVLCAWNALMISALAKGWQVLGDARYLKAAQDCAQFLFASMFDADQQRLYRRYAEGERAVEGMASDYADLIQACLDLYESDGEGIWLTRAETLASVMRSDFFEETTGAVFNCKQGQDPHLLSRLQETHDNVEPSAASVLASVFLRLDLLTEKAGYREAGLSALKALGASMARQPRAAAAALSALDLALGPPTHVVVLSPPDSEMLAAVRRVFSPRRALIALAPGAAGAPGFTKDFQMLQGKPTAYVCVDRACRLPSADSAEVSRLITASA
ncbi:MAG: thioredoxin domain-containing protein [candidate division FCPU426 bacterium]